MTERQTITAAAAPAAIGPYVHAVRHGDVLYCSGSLPLDPATGELDDATLSSETTRALRNLEAVCAEAGTVLQRALQTTIYTTNLEGFAEINEAYGAFFPGDAPPARVTIGVAALPKGARVEIAAVVAAEQA